ARIAANPGCRDALEAADIDAGVIREELLQDRQVRLLLHGMDVARGQLPDLDRHLRIRPRWRCEQEQETGSEQEGNREAELHDDFGPGWRDAHYRLSASGT